MQSLVFWDLGAETAHRSERMQSCGAGMRVPHPVRWKGPLNPMFAALSRKAVLPRAKLALSGVSARLIFTTLPAGLSGPSLTRWARSMPSFPT